MFTLVSTGLRSYPTQAAVLGAATSQSSLSSRLLHNKYLAHYSSRLIWASFPLPFSMVYFDSSGLFHARLCEVVTDPGMPDQGEYQVWLA
jgi:hypothetical protein